MAQQSISTLNEVITLSKKVTASRLTLSSTNNQIKDVVGLLRGVIGL